MTAPPLPTLAAYQASIVWSTGTDSDTSAYDNVSYLNQPGVSISGLGRATHRAYAPPGTPSLDLTLPNDDGRYAPGGPLGLFVGRGPAATFSASWGVDVLCNSADVLANDPDVLANGRLIASLFTGVVDTADQELDRGAASVQVRALGRMAQLGRERPRTTVYENIRTDQAITVILDAVGWPSADREIDTGDTTLLYWWLDGDTTAADAINALLVAEGVPACAYEDGAGVFHFEGRQYRINAARSNTVQWYLFDGPTNSGNATANDPTVLANDPNVFANGPLSSIVYHMVPSRWTSNPDEVVKSVTASVNVRTPTATQKVWEFGGPLVLSSGETRDVWATSSDPFTSAVTPQSGTDYTVASGALTSVTLLETSGQRVRIRWVAGVGGATINGVTSDGPQLRAISLPVTTTVPVTSTVDTDLTAARYQPGEQTLAIWPEMEVNQALDNCNNFARRYQRPRDQMTVQLVNTSADQMYAMLTMRISDRVLIRHTRGRVNAEFYVESMSHGLTDGGGLHRLLLNCERVTDDTPSVFGTARFDINTFTG